MQSNQTSRIGGIIRSERERQGLKQTELALAAGVSYRTVLQIEKGKPTSRLDVLLRVLEALGLTLDVRAAPRSLSDTSSLPLAHFEIHGAADTGYRWSLVAVNGERIASSDSYPSRSATARSIRAFQQLLQSAASAEAD